MLFVDPPKLINTSFGATFTELGLITTNRPDGDALISKFDGIEIAVRVDCPLFVLIVAPITFDGICAAADLLVDLLALADGVN